ncbi:MAG: XdhC family protein [Coriobacteriia bacterium]|nr:XdhC family protein [Coriobacteriia bacterium]
MAEIAHTLEQALDSLRATGAFAWDSPAIMFTSADIPVLERALQAARRDEQAWLGFKLVTDSRTCTQGTGWEPYPDGSANTETFPFFANEALEIVCGYEYSPRDRFQMLDITRGPSMHFDQFPGLTWSSIPLFTATRLVIFGASDVARYTASYAADAGFEVEVVDPDPSFLSEERFPHAKRILTAFDQLASIELGRNDFACVLTRNHAHDPEALMHALKSPAAYVGLIGHVDKIAGNFELLRQHGIAAEEFSRVHAPIGIKCGAKTPAEIAISITAQLIQERHNR